MKLRCVNIVLILFLSLNGTAQDSIVKQVTLNPTLGFDITNVGYYGTIGTQIQYKKISIILSYIIDYSKAEYPFDGPFGLATSFSFFPNSDNRTINHFVNFDYRITFHERFCTYDCSQKYNKTQEINIGYGLSIKLIKRISISNSINVGWFFENSLSDRTSKTITNNGSNSLINTSINFSLNK